MCAPFLGLAEHVFSSDLSTLTDKRKRLAHLETRQEYFRELMQKLLPDLMGDSDLSSGVTAGAVEKAVERIEAELGQVAQRRNVLMAEVRDQASRSARRTWPNSGRAKSDPASERTGARGELAALNDRVKELDEYNTGLKREAQRLDRADAAADVLEDIKVTHCPACDQSSRRERISRLIASCAVKQLFRQN